MYSPGKVCVIWVSVAVCSDVKKVLFEPSSNGVVPPGDILTGIAAENYFKKVQNGTQYMDFKRHINKKNKTNVTSL